MNKASLLAPCPDVKYILLYPDPQGGDDKASVRFLSRSTPSRPVEREHLGRRRRYHNCCCRRWNVRNHRGQSTVTDTNAGSVRSDQLPLLSDVPGHPTAGAFGRSESTPAFTTCGIRLIGNLWDDSQHPTPLSVAGGTSRIVTFDQRFSTRTLGAFVPSNSPFIQTVPDTRICSSCPPTPSFAAFGPSLHIRLQGLFVGVKAPSLSQPVAFD